MRLRLESRLGGAVAVGALALGGGLVTATAAHAAGTTCSAAWSASTVYTGGQTASENGVNYTANWWTQGDDPATHNGAGGTGQPWTSQGACTGGSSDPGDGGTTDPGDGGNPGGGTGDGSGVVFAPYKDITVLMGWNTNTMRTAAGGSTLPLVGANSFVSKVVPNLGAITLAFATGTCQNEGWAGVNAQSFVSANIGALDAADLDYTVSTGGAAGSFTCSSGADLEKFIARYATPHLIGIDFDIENGMSSSDIANLVNAAAQAESAYPNLRFSFTLATWAGSDGSHAGVNALGTSVVNAIKASSLSHYTIDLMVMDYGGPSAAVCVVSNGQCQMGRSAIQAAENLEYTFGIPASKIELCPMIGPNDVAGENFSLSDVDTVTSYVKTHGLAGIRYWSLDRDSGAQYTKRFLQDLGR
ncbi:carbohydrate-binding protein [Luteimicrobium sp. NPDC057192]|uniref:carbohydrate-binding protein n=1 Tax=Luteimicrobium sp. NPDC057192 TaxID=3346042 RepID=UPI0036292DA5